MMDHLKRAREYVTEFTHEYPLADAGAFAQAHAMIAIAEELKRLNDRAEAKTKRIRVRTEVEEARLGQDQWSEEQEELERQRVAAGQ